MATVGTVTIATWWRQLRERVRTWIAPDSVPADLFGWWSPYSTAQPVAYERIYRTQPHVRTVVEFLAIQMGQLGIHVYRRLSDTDRVRVPNHPLARLLQQPNAETTRARWVGEMATDYAVYGNAYALKIRTPNRLQLYRVPAGAVVPHGDLVPRAYTYTLPYGGPVTVAASEMFHLRSYTGDGLLQGLSPLESLRQILAEETASTAYREAFWQNAARLSGWISRPKDAPRWTEPQRESFVRDITRYKRGGDLAGGTPVLEDGMEFTPNTATARDAQLVEVRQLTREEVAAAFHVPPAMIGILEAQGYGSLREQHRVLYADTLGPHIAVWEGDIKLQLLSEFSDAESVYPEFNVGEKLQGNFEEQAAALHAAVGVPWMTPNEARARLNLPRINDPSYDRPAQLPGQPVTVGGA